MIVESDGVLRMGDRLYVADVDGLRHAILEEAHNSKYTIHPGPTKMYHDLKQFYWWEDRLTKSTHFLLVKTTYGGVRSEDMLRACILEFGGSWDTYLPLAEFAYNNSFQSSIQMAPYEALYGRRCRSPMGWFEAGETNLLGLDLVQEAMDKVQLIRQRLLTAQMFHVSMLRKCMSDSSQVLEAPAIPLDEKLSYEEESMAIIDRQNERKPRDCEETVAIPKSSHFYCHRNCDEIMNSGPSINATKMIVNANPANAKKQSQLQSLLISTVIAIAMKLRTVDPPQMRPK
ncbi:PREDICTED: uncharacterized protein LOC109217486 [Nicotiana attenuata]|uniref:uncharacterized protein LOC109217486 n=1 Tax=Nicotiana attenuata TaxID=49451 RepID=UPI000904AC3C|nr:PREDICTED: uncharacterized protein LOC109217486 [Nicotiana attenuata]